MAPAKSDIQSSNVGTGSLPPEFPPPLSPPPELSPLVVIAIASKLIVELAPDTKYTPN